MEKEFEQVIGDSQIKSLAKYNIDCIVKNDAKTISPETKRISSIHQIDINENHFRINDGKDPVVFFHIKEGNVTETSGVYICSREFGDKYGQFFLCNERKLKKYNAKTVTHYKFDEDDLKVLQKRYHELKVKVVTEFTYSDINQKGYEEVEDKRRFQLIEPVNNKSNGFLMFPNFYRMEKDEHKKEPTSLKYSMTGITLYAWAIHPSISKKICFMGDTMVDMDNKENDTQLMEFEKKTGIKYLSTILDLDKTDIHMLERLKKDVNNHLCETYHVDADFHKVRLFFHFPVDEETATLHMHIHVNQGDAILNCLKSYMLDDIILHFKQGKSILSMVAERNGGNYYSIKDNEKSVIYTFRLGTVENPYRLEPSTKRDTKCDYQSNHSANTPEETINREIFFE